MDITSGKIFDEIILNYIEERNIHIQNYQKEAEGLLSDFMSIDKPNTIEVFSELLSSFELIANEHKKENKAKSIDFNPLNYFAINEPLHSRLLADLLNPHAEHGQGNLFLKVFLTKLGIEKPDSTNWVISAEKERIDILLKRVEPHSIIIIENKSNWAVDQPNQLYRYWYYQMYKNRQKVNFDFNNKEEVKKYYRILYFTPHKDKLPTGNSLSKPTDSTFSKIKDLPPKVPITTEPWVFNKCVVEWLEESLKLLPESNHRLKEYIKQYIELLSNL